MRTTTYGLSVAGLDPSGGAGILADAKTFEALGVQGFGVSTSTTYQNEHTFNGISWLHFDEIVNQLDPLFDAYPIEYAKIGLIENLDVLKGTLAYLKERNKDIFIVWDPILSSSAGYQFHGDGFLESNNEILNAIGLFTPNMEEMKKLYPGNKESEIGIKLSTYCAVLLKGGHSQTEHSDDLLFEDGNTTIIKGIRYPYDKHGTGCVLSAAIVAHLALGDNLEHSCREAKNYVNQFLISNGSLLGTHSLQNA